MKVFASWSGGKDSALATYKAISQGHQVIYLVTFLSEDGQKSRAHGIRREVLAMQAEAIGVPLIQVKTSWEEYERNFKKTCRELKQRGVEGGVFGDVDLEEHRAWVERVCGETEIKPLLPLWQIEPASLINEFLKLKFKAIVVATKLDNSFLGRSLDKTLITEFKRLNCQLLGENGEYHTFVTEGPIFRKSLKIIDAQKRTKEGTFFLDIAVKLE